MSAPFKIVVVADLGATQVHKQTAPLYRKGTQALMERLRPKLDLDEPPVHLGFSTLTDFEPKLLALQIPEVVESDEALTALLHNPRFQALESAWRGVDILASRLPRGDVEIEVLSCTEADLVDSFYEAIYVPEIRDNTLVPAGLIILDFDFDHHTESLGTFAKLAKMAEAMHTPLVASTGPSFFEAQALEELSQIRNPFTRIKGTRYAGFNRFRASETSFWAGLTINRFLARPLHETSGYQEHTSETGHGYLWARGIWLTALAAAHSHADNGHFAQMSGARAGAASELPFRAAWVEGHAQLCFSVESLWTIDIVESMPYFGFTPLAQIPPDMGGQHRPDLVYVHLAVNLHRTHDPDKKKYGLVKVQNTLAYSLTLGRVIRLARRLLPSVTDHPAQEAADLLADLMAAELRADKDELLVVRFPGALRVKYQPCYLLHENEFVVDFDLPFSNDPS